MGFAIAILLRLLGAAAGIWLCCLCCAGHAPSQEEGTTGLLVDEGEGKHFLYSFTFLADGHWVGAAITVPDITGLLGCIHYDTTEDGSGHVFTLWRRFRDVRVEVVRSNGSRRTLRQGEELLLENLDTLTITQGAHTHRYRYLRTSIHPKRKEEEKWPS